MTTIIKTTDLTKVYGQQISVNHVNLNVQKGEIYGFLGRNGAGKTTTIRMLLGLIKPSHGEIEVFGQSFKKHKKEILKRIGSIVEVPGFYENLTARENLLINAKIIGVHKKNAIEEALEIVGLQHETKKLVGMYSLGMKQRLGIARALLHYPELLILDEPTNGLDPIGIKEMRRLIKSLAEERRITIFISSHILSEIEQLVDRIGIIHDGKLLEEVEFEHLRKMNRRYVEFQVSADNKAALLLEQKFNIHDYEVHDDKHIRVYSHLELQSKINKVFVQNDIDVYKMYLSEDKLEDYFTRLVGGGLLVNLLYTELLKLKRSKMFLISLLGSSVAPLMIVVASYVHMKTKNPVEIITFEKLFFEANLYTIVIIGVPLYGVVTAYLFNREYLEDTLKNLLTIPISRTSFVLSKLIVLFIWIILLSLVAWGLTLILGILGGFEGLNTTLIWVSFRKFMIGGGLLFFLSSPVVLVTLVMKNYVPTIIFTIVITLLNVMSSNSEHRGLFPWAAAGDIANGTLLRTYPPEFSYLSIAITVIIGLFATFSYFMKTDIH